jgi:polyhydroxyalkanoate synthesis regulator phasin
VGCLERRPTIPTGDADDEEYPMPQSPDWKQLIETGMNFTEMQRSQARKFVAELVAQGQLAQDRAAATVDEMLETSRRSRENLRAFVQSEIQRQVRALGIATRDDLARLERKLAEKPAAKRSTTKGAATAKKAPAKKSAAKEPAAMSSTTRGRA